MFRWPLSVYWQASLLFFSWLHWLILLHLLHRDSRVGGKFCPIWLHWTRLPIVRFQNSRGWLEREHPDTNLDMWHSYVYLALFLMLKIQRRKCPFPWPAPILLFPSIDFGSMARAYWCSLAFIVSLCVNSNAGTVPYNLPSVVSSKTCCRIMSNYVRILKLVNWPRSNMSGGIIITFNYFLIKKKEGSPKQALSHHMSWCFG